MATKLSYARSHIKSASEWVADASASATASNRQIRPLLRDIRCLCESLYGLCLTAEAKLRPNPYAALLKKHALGRVKTGRGKRTRLYGVL